MVECDCIGVRYVYRPCAIFAHSAGVVFVVDGDRHGAALLHVGGGAADDGQSGHRGEDGSTLNRIKRAIGHADYTVSGNGMDGDRGNGVVDLDGLDVHARIGVVARVCGRGDNASNRLVSEPVACTVNHHGTKGIVAICLDDIFPAPGPSAVDRGDDGRGDDGIAAAQQFKFDVRSRADDRVGSRREHATVGQRFVGCDEVNSACVLADGRDREHGATVVNDLLDVAECGGACRTIGVLEGDCAGSAVGVERQNSFVELGDVQAVAAAATVDGVVACATIDGVIAVTTVDRVVAVATMDGVFAIAAVNRIIAIAAVDRVVAVTTADGVIAFAAVDRVVAIAAGY